MGGAQAHGRRGLRGAGLRRVHALLRDGLRIHGPRRGGRGARGRVQHRRRGAGLHRRPRGRACRACLRFLVPVDRRPAGDRGGVRLRRRLGIRARVAPGAPGKPHRHHHDHVQFHSVGAHDVLARERPHQARPAVARVARVRAGRGHALGSPGAGHDRDPLCAFAVQPSVAPCARRLPPGLGVHLAHTLGIRAQGVRPEPAGRPIRRNLPAADHPRFDADIRRPCRLPRGE